jgi:hypothetical protein
MRVFRSHNSCSCFLYVLHLMHKFIKPSMALNGEYPAERANIKLPLGRNRLLTLTQISATAI